MQIPIQNIYYLLCYAWDKLEERDVVSISQIDKNRIINLFAKVLIHGISHLLKKGLDRGYLLHTEPTSSLRGKINFSATLKQTYFRQPVVVCEYDELSHNVLHNRILKTTIRMLIQCQDVEESLHESLVEHYRRLHEIDEIPFGRNCFRLVQLNRNNYFYDLLLKICELIWDNLLISEETGKSRFKDFLQDEDRMSDLFEAFVRNFFKKEQTQFRVCRENIIWDATSKDGMPVTFLPQMKTDISLISSTRKLVIDTKYYKEALQVHYDKESIRSNNLYQLYAYLKNLEARGLENINCEGILLYPTVEYDLAEECEIQGHRVMVRTINLNQDWRSIHKDLLALIN